MWTAATRTQHKLEGLRVASDLTDAEWAVLEPLLLPRRKSGRRPVWPMREIVNAIFYVLRGGIPWRMLPPFSPPHQTVHAWFATLRDEGVWQNINHQHDPHPRQSVARRAACRCCAPRTMGDDDVPRRSAHRRHHRPCVFDGSINGTLFRARVEQQLLPTLRPGDVVVLDNLGSHKGLEVRRTIRRAGAHLLFLPPYSPDLSPIEMMFVKLKALLHNADES